MRDPNNALRPRAAILGCAGLELSAEEARFFADVQPLGFILFRRNCESPAQVSALVAALRASVGRDQAPVLIDQEGGRVQRLAPPNWPQRPPQASFAALARQSRDNAIEAAMLNAALIAGDLSALGIDVNCLPLLDVPVPGSHDVIGDRAFGGDPEIVAALGQAVVQGLQAGGVLPVIKHIPGHGRAKSDSHMELPTVDASLEELRACDFAPFKALNSAPWAMTAHIVYSSIDPMQPATLSPRVIGDIIRGEIGFDGFLVSDDVTMKALIGNYGELAAAAVAAGCDAVLHCDGDMSGMIDVMSSVPELSEVSWGRFMNGQAVVGPDTTLDLSDAEQRLRELLSTND